MTALTDGDRLRLRMQRIRSRMHAKIDGLRLDAESWTDWRYYVCQFPWTSLATAAVMGFWLTPGRYVTPTVKLDDQSIDELIHKGGLRIEPPPAAKTDWLRALGATSGNFALRAVLGYVTQQLVARNFAAADEPVEAGR
jgi:hypothetical protein